MLDLEGGYVDVVRPLLAAADTEPLAACAAPIAVALAAALTTGVEPVAVALAVEGPFACEHGFAAFGVLLAVAGAHFGASARACSAIGCQRRYSAIHFRTSSAVDAAAWTSIAR